MRNRSARRGWFVASAGVFALVAIGAACSKSSSPEAANDAGVGPGNANDDATTSDSGVSFTLDAFPTTFPDATTDDGGASDDASDDVTTSPHEGGGGCAKPAPNDPCGLDPQCGCPAQETCEVDGGGTICVTAGNALVGHACASTASCAPGLTCLGGACRPYCSSTGDAGCNAKLPEGGACIAVTGADGGPLPNFDVCTFDCQLQDPKACGSTGDLNAGCTYDNAGGTDCQGLGLTGLGGACGFLNDCLPGLVCTGTCLQWCRVGHSPSDCGDGEACQAFGGTGVTANGVQYGYCP